MNQVVGRTKEKEDGNQNLWYGASVPASAGRLFKYLRGRLGAAWIAKLLCDNPLVYTPELKQTDECRLRPVERHNILEEDPERYEVDRTEIKRLFEILAQILSGVR